MRLAKPNASRKEAETALHKAQCDDIIAKLPDGIDTVIGTKGVYLSGGEQQRIAITRVMLKDAPIIVLDEATAFADPENESLVQRAFEELAKDKTVIMIAHRLTTVRNADRMFVLQDGRVEESGTHDKLAEQSGLLCENVAGLSDFGQLEGWRCKMISGIMKRFALSRDGAKGLVWATIACTASDIVLMFPVGLLYDLVNDFMKGAVPKSHCVLYGIGIAVALFLIFLSEFWKYNATYFSTYRESGKCRIRLAEKLRRLPLSFFGKKALADLTNTMLGDVTTTEQMFSHYVPQFYASVISTCIIAVSLFFLDWRLALAALWVLPVALLIVGLSKKAQNYFSRKQNMAQIAV